MLHVIARGCLSTTPVRGWHEVYGCWYPPGWRSAWQSPAGSPSWWTPFHLAALGGLVLCLGLAMGAAIAIVRDLRRNRRFQNDRREG